MKLSDSLKIAFTGLETNKTRSFLAMLGIVIGISAVIVMLSIGQGVQNVVLSQIETMGHNVAFVIPGGTKQEKGLPQFSLGMMEVKTLKTADAEALKKGFYIKEVTPIVFGPAVLNYKNETRRSDFTGTVSNLQNLKGYKMLEGNFFTEDEEKSMQKVVVIGKTVKEKMFKNQKVIRERLKINRQPFRIIGVMEVEKMGGSHFIDVNDKVFIPLSVAQKQMLGTDYFTAILLQSTSAETLDLAVAEAEEILRQRHGIKDSSQDDFTIMSQEYIASTFNLIGGILTIFLAVVAGISLVVGGIGIMNIMLVSVTERTREIGLRKAVGARKKDILNQFLLEAVTLTILGGMIGIIFGFIGSYLGSIILGKILDITWGFTISFSAIILAFSVATAIGLIFGIYPAHKAAELSPIEALRYE